MKDIFLERTSAAWNVSASEAERLLNTRYATTIRINPLKVRKSTLSNLKKQYANVEKLEWINDAYFFVDPQPKPSLLPEFANGEIIIQNPASFIPILELQPQANQTILDMCAAPGAKSSHIAALTNNKATLILNDTSRTRFFKMKKLMHSMDVTAEYSLRDGRNLSKEYGNNAFDAILLDAPCSGEANIKLDAMQSWSLATIKRLSSLQSRLLQEAFTLLKPGGRLVYSTCTIAPEENELVIDTLLRHNPPASIIQPKTYPTRALNGIIRWNDKDLSSDIKKCIRLLPTETTKPFFIAVITKDANMHGDDDDSYERLVRSFSK